MTRPAVCDAPTQYLVRETDDERASEIGNEFYPEGRWSGDEHVDPPDRTDADEQNEQSQRICELARRLGYRDVKTRMLLGQWATNLVGLERRLQEELDRQTERTPTPPASEFGHQEKLNQPSQVGHAQVSNLTEELISVEGFPL